MDTTVRSLHLGYRFRTAITGLSKTTRGRSHMLIDSIWPPYALHLQCADMELSPVRDADLPELAEIARNGVRRDGDRKSTRLNSSHVSISYAVFCLKKKKQIHTKRQC